LDLIQDPIVQYNIDYKAKFYQAYLVKQYLSQQPEGDITEEEQRAAFKGMGMNSANSRSFSGWVITADNFADANINSGSLEGSNVDLAKEFTDMITSQRAYQSNARVISTSDEMLMEAVNLKR
jgi:flagellar hook protein FlgE